MVYYVYDRDDELLEMPIGEVERHPMIDTLAFKGIRFYPSSSASASSAL
jgi:hypothetical protein